MTVHELAPKIEMWTTIAVNSWLIISVLAYLVLRLGSDSEPTAWQVARAVMYAGNSVTVMAILMFFVWLRGAEIDLVVGAGTVALVLVAIIQIGLYMLRLRSKSKL